MVNLPNRGNLVTMCPAGALVFALYGLPQPLYFPNMSYENQPLSHLIYYTIEAPRNEATYETDQQCYPRLTPGRRKACLQAHNRLVFNNKYLLLINSFIN